MLDFQTVMPDEALVAPTKTRYNRQNFSNLSLFRIQRWMS